MATAHRENPTIGSVWSGLWFGALAALAFAGLPALRAAGLGLDAAPPAETGLLAAIVVGGGCFGLLARRLAWSAARLGLAVAAIAAVLAAGQGGGLVELGDRPAAAWIALTLGLALGHFVPPRGWLALLAALVAAVVVLAAAPVCSRMISAPARVAGLLLTPPIALLAVGRPRAGARGQGRVVDAILGLGAAALGLAITASLEPPVTAPDDLVTLAADPSRRAVAAYDPATQEMQFWQAGDLVAAEGPDRPRSAFLATTVAALTRPGDRVLALGVGLGRLPAALDRAGVPDVEFVNSRTAIVPLLARLSTIGAVAPPPVVADAGRSGPDSRGASDQDGTIRTGGAASSPEPAGVGLDGSSARLVRPAGWVARARVAGALATLARLPAGSRQAILLGDDLGGGATLPWQCSLLAQAELRRVVGHGVVLQPFALDRTRPARLRTLFGAAVAVHPWNGVLAIGNCGLLLSAARTPDWPRAGDFAGWSEGARWQAHLAHLGSGADLQRAWLGTVAIDRVADAWPPAIDEPSAEAESAAPGRPLGRMASARRATLRVLHDCLEPAPALSGRRSSLLLWHVDLHSRMRAFERQLRGAAAGDAQRERLRRAALTFLPTGARSAALQAALALPDGSGRGLRDPHQASLAAFAIDPTFHSDRPPLLADLPRPQRRVGDLADFAFLPPPGRLRELCVGGGPLAIALRSRFPTACARALIAALRHGPLEPLAAEALRELADPFVLSMAARAVASRAGERELLGLWRRDLAMPAALRVLRAGTVADRRDLAAALTGRQDARAITTLADLMLDDAATVRRAAADAVLVTSAGAVEFDPKWPRGKRFVAAERLRSLHNRAP